MNKKIYSEVLALYERCFDMPVYLRFELGEPHANGSQARIRQVVSRVHSLFEDVFAAEGTLYLLAKDYRQPNIKIAGDTTPDYLYELLEGQAHIDKRVGAQSETPAHLLRCYSGQPAALLCKQILTGIAYYEQGREPSIAQSVYFLDLGRRLVFYMYDDRGCIIYADEPAVLRPLYEAKNDWLVDYWRADMDAFFKT